MHLINAAGKVQHRPPCTESARRARIAPCDERTGVIVVFEAMPPGSCVGCGGAFKPWGYARTRVIRERGGVRRPLRPRRIRCGRCRVTHVLLSAVFAPRRVDSAHVIFAALLAKSGGHRAIATDLALPPGTVRGGLRRASANAEQVRARTTHLAIEADPLIGLAEPTGTVLGDALGRAVAAVRRRLGPLGTPTALAMIIAVTLLRQLRT